MVLVVVVKNNIGGSCGDRPHLFGSRVGIGGSMYISGVILVMVVVVVMRKSRSGSGDDKSFMASNEW